MNTTEPYSPMARANASAKPVIAAGATVGATTRTTVCQRLAPRTAARADYCNLQFPTTISIPAGADTPLVYGRVFENGITQPAGAPPGVSAEVGVGPAGSNPTTQAGWQFVDASYNVQVGNDDEYMRSLVAPATPGTYAYTYRFSFDGVYWTYCDADGAGANSGLDFSASQLGVLTITP